MSLREKLVSLSGIDKQINGLTARLNAANIRLNAQQEKLDRLAQQQAELLDQDKRLKVAIQRLENEGASREEKIKTYREQMNAVTSNKEYSALLVEINTIKAEKDKLDTITLEHMTAHERLTERLNDMNAKVDEQTKMVDIAKQEVQESKDAIAERLEELNAERAQAVEGIPGDALKTYDKAAHAHDGDAMSTVTCQDKRRKEFTCDNCFRMLPIECVNTLLTREDDLVNCPSCGVLLYVNPAFKETMAPKAK